MFIVVYFIGVYTLVTTTYIDTAGQRILLKVLPMRNKKNGKYMNTIADLYHFPLSFPLNSLLEDCQRKIKYNMKGNVQYNNREYFSFSIYILNISL